MSDGDALSSGVDSGGLLPAGTVLGDYQIVRSVGSGGMAVVYEGRHRTLNKRVAIKVLDSGHSGTKADLAKRFLREAENAARLSHRHVVDVSNVGVANGLPYLIMEFLEGEDLGKYLERRGKLSVESAADLIIPVVCAIRVAHESGIVHRDLKPQNIFLCTTRNSDEPTPKVVDFGISKLLDNSTMQLTGSNSILGTPFYMSPEQAMEAKNVDGRTDQFSLGVILYECVTGRRPFEGDSLFTVLTAIVHLDHNPPSALTYPMDPKFEALVDRALSKKPDQRFASMQEFGRELLTFASLRVQMLYASELGATLPPAVRREAERQSSLPPAKHKPKQAKAKANDKAAATAGADKIDDKKRLVFVAVAGALLLGCFLLWWSARDSRGQSARGPVPALPTAPKPPAKPETSDWGDDPGTAKDGVGLQVAAPSEPSTPAPTPAPAPEAVAPAAPVTALPSAREGRSDAKSGSTATGSVAVGTSSAPAASNGVTARGAESASRGGETRPTARPGESAPATGEKQDAAPRSKPERGANRALILQ
jgi:serine/threonine protein kinase